MSIQLKLGRELTSLSDVLKSLESQLNTSRDLINSYANSANSATTKSSYDTYVEKYNIEKNNFDNLLEQYESNGGQYSTTLERYNTLSFSTRGEVISYDIPNPKDPHQWLAGGTFYNEKYPGGFVWSATNPLAPDERVKQDLGLVINRGNFHSYLNEGFTEIQNTLHGFGFLDLLGDYTENKANIFEVTVTVVTSDGSVYTENKYINEGSGDLEFSNITNQKNMSLDSISEMLSTPGMNLTTINAMGVVEFTITNVLNGNMFESGKVKIGDIIGASLLNTVTNTLSQKLALGIVNSLGVTNIVAAGIISIGVGSLVSEVLEVAMGVDNHFGFGGDIMKDAFGNVRTDDAGNPQYERASSLIQSLRTGVIDLLGYSIASSLLGGITDENRYEQWEQQGFSVEDMRNAMNQSDNLNDLPDFDVKEIDWEASWKAVGIDPYSGVRNDGRDYSSGGEWGDGGSNNTDGMGNNSKSDYGDESGYGDGNGGFGGI